MEEITQIKKTKNLSSNYSTQSHHVNTTQGLHINPTQSHHINPTQTHHVNPTSGHHVKFEVRESLRNEKNERDLTVGSEDEEDLLSYEKGSFGSFADDERDALEGASDEENDVKTNNSRSTQGDNFYLPSGLINSELEEETPIQTPKTNNSLFGSNLFSPFLTSFPPANRLSTIFSSSSNKNNSQSLFAATLEQWNSYMYQPRLSPPVQQSTPNITPVHPVFPSIVPTLSPASLQTMNVDQTNEDYLSNRRPNVLPVYPPVT